MDGPTRGARRDVDAELECFAEQRHRPRPDRLSGTASRRTRCLAARRLVRRQADSRARTGLGRSTLLRVRRRRRTAESIPEASGRTRASLVAASYASTFSYAGTLSLAVALAAVTVVVSWPTLEAFWRAPQIGSFDGMSHLVVGEYYAGHIFPRTWGWAPYWFAGMPFPTFYPPLFYFSTALLYHILPFSYPAVAKSVLCLLLVALPGLSGSITWFHTRSFYAALATGCLTVAVLSDPHNTFGIAIAATLTRGLFTQLPGYVCLLLWCHLFLLAPCSRRSGYFSMFFLFLVLLSNVHVVPIVAALFLVVLFLDLVQAWRHRDLTPFLNSLGRHTVLGFIPLLAASFWYVPLMASSDYLVTMALPPMSAGHIATVWMVPGVLTAVATALSMARGARSIQAVALVCPLLAVISTLDSARFFPSLGRCATSTASSERCTRIGA